MQANGYVRWWKWLAPLTVAGVGVVMWLTQLGISGELRLLLANYLHSRYTPADPPPVVVRSPSVSLVDLEQLEPPPDWATERLFERLPPIHSTKQLTRQTTQDTD